MIFNAVVLFLLVKQTTEEMYDEDINLVFPASLIYRSPTVERVLQYMGSFNNCECRENPKELAVCLGNLCKQFPLGINTSAPRFKLKLTAIATIRKEDLLSLSNIEHMEIEANSHLWQIEAGSFRNLTRLQNLTISSNMNLTKLETGVFEGLKNLQTLCLAKNGFRRVSDVTVALPPKDVPSIVLLDLTENMLHEIKFDDFFPMNGSSLSELNVILCEIDSIHIESLAPLRNLSSLRMAQNLLNRTVLTKFIQRTLELGIPLDLLNLFESGLRKWSPYILLEAVGKSNISYLNLGGNHFDYIDDEWFPYMPNLLTLDFRKSLITYISSNAFRNLTNIQCLLLDENNLSHVPIGAMLVTLTILDFGGNSIHPPDFSPSYFSVPDGIFCNLTILDNLQLPYNYIGVVTKSMFVGLKNLKQLNLKNTSLTHVENEAFMHLENLLHFNLKNNLFPVTMRLTAEIFKGLSKLKILLLGGCSIRNLTMTPSLFYYTPNLTYLDLGNNGLHTIAPHQLTSLNHLKRLQVAENSLTPWNAPILPHLSLSVFVGSQNKLTHITPAMLADWQTIETLLLDGNPLTCDCSLFPVVYWLRFNKLSLVLNDSENFVAKCVAPEVWHKESIVKFIHNLKQDPGQCENGFTPNEVLLISIGATFFVLILLTSILGYVYRWYIRYFIFLYRISLKKHSLWYARKSNHLKASTTFEYDAFVSYCNEDRDFVKVLIEKMENEQPWLKLCVYERDFQLGSLISDSVLHSVAVSKRTLLIISNGFARSQWCRWETQLAEYHHLFFQNENSDGPDDTLLMIKLEDVNKARLTPTLKYLMKTRIYLEWDAAPEKQELFWKRLRTTIATSKGRLHQELIK